MQVRVAGLKPSRDSIRTDPDMSRTSTIAADKQPVIRVTAMPADTNPYGDIFGGWLVGQMDLAAASVASRYCHGRAATVSIDKVVFHHPVKVGDEVSIFAALAKVGRTSMQIIVEAYQRDRGSETVSKVTEAIFVFVAVDENGRPRQVEPN